MSSNLPITEADLQAYVDGRLAEGRRGEVEAWLASRPDETERVAQLRAQRDALRALYDSVLDESVPERLSKIAERGPRSRGLALVAGWIAIGAFAGLLAGWQLRAWQEGPAPAMSEGT